MKVFLIIHDNVIWLVWAIESGDGDFAEKQNCCEWIEF